MMKMKNRYIVVFLSLLIGLSACDEREPGTFQNISGIIAVPLKSKIVL